MLLELFLIECKRILKCSTYYVLIICMLLFYITQIGNFEMIEKPVQGLDDYGTRYSEDENIIMDETLKTIIREFSANSYVTYPIGFYKEVILNEEKQLKIAGVLAEVTGLKKDDLISAIDVYYSSDVPTREELGLTIKEDMTYEYFKELMDQANQILGGGSRYRSSILQTNAWVPMTYEDAMREYNSIVYNDHLSGAFARLFSDYMGIILTILPVFLAVTRGLRDKRARANQVIYSRAASSFNIIISRYLSMLVMIMVPVLLMGGWMTLQCVYNGSGEGIFVDVFAFAKYTFGWLLPGIMISTSVGVFLTELTETAIGILVMGVWWFASIFMGIVTLRGGYSLNLIPRHNTLGNYQIYQENFNILALNRGIYTLAAIILTVAAVYIYSMKRKGKLIIHGKISSNRKSKSKA